MINLVEILINIGISFAVSILSAIIILCIYHKKYGFRCNKHNNEFQDLKSLEDRIDDIEKKVNSNYPTKECKSDRVKVDSNLPITIEPPKELKKEASKNNENIKLVSPQEKKVSPIIQRPEDGSYFYLKVADGKLVLSEFISYYRAWESNNNFYYEFHCDKSKMAKVINNRSVLLEPFCRKESSSEDADNATSIVPIKPGTLDKNNYAITEKTIIKFE